MLPWQILWLHGLVSSTIKLVHATIKYVGLPTRGRGEFALNLGFVN
jgi:hypothetical protein